MAEEASAPTQTQDPAKKAPAGFKSFLGIKRGMTQVYDKEGKLHAVTVIEAGPCTVLRVRDDKPDGYRAVQLGFVPVKEKNLPSPLVGQFKKAGFPAMRYEREVRVKDTAGFEAGQILDLHGRFTPGDYVDVRAFSKGKGFQGAMKRHGFAGLPGSHGASDKERSPGSLASRRALGRVLPGQRMAGHTGYEMTTIQKMEIIEIDEAANRLMINGAVPGPSGALVQVFETVKEKKHKVVQKQPTVLRDKMGNIIQTKSAKARAQADAKAKAAATPAKPAGK